MNVITSSEDNEKCYPCCWTLVLPITPAAHSARTSDRAREISEGIVRAKLHGGWGPMSEQNTGEDYGDGNCDSRGPRANAAP
jgi:hypothetical protein